MVLFWSLKKAKLFTKRDLDWLIWNADKVFRVRSFQRTNIVLLTFLHFYG
jgi:hypothetical protein